MASAPSTGDVDGGAAEPVRAATVPFRVPSLSSATRDYAYALTAGTLPRLSAGDLTRLTLSMGPDIWGWQYALRLTGQAPWRAGSNEAEPVARARAARKMMSDIVTWERALAEVDAEAARARAYGKPAPAPLELPAAVSSVIAARRQAALERATRRKRSEDGGDALVPKPEGTPPPPGMPA